VSTSERVLICILGLILVLFGSCAITLDTFLSRGRDLGMLFVALLVLVGGIWAIVAFWRWSRPAGDA
jgi:hypothetical protein